MKTVFGETFVFQVLFLSEKSFIYSLSSNLIKFLFFFLISEFCFLSKKKLSEISGNSGRTVISELPQKNNHRNRNHKNVRNEMH